MKTLLMATALSCGLAVTPALAGPYNVNLTIGAGSVSGSITTDGTIGTLTTSNITAFDLLLNDGSGTFETTQANGAVLVAGTALTATTAALSFNFSAAGFQYAQFQSPSLGSGKDAFCLQTSACFDFGGPGEDVVVNTPIPGQVSRQTGLVAFATASTVNAIPEPASLVLLGAGLAGLGLVRRGRKSA